MSYHFVSAGQFGAELNELPDNFAQIMIPREKKTNHF